MFASIWKSACRIGLVIGALLTFFAFAEFARFTLLLYRLDPLWAYLFLSVTGVLALYGLLRMWRVYVRNPRALKPPPRPDLAEDGYKNLRRYCDYLLAYQQRLARNKRLPEETLLHLNEHLASARSTLDHHPINDDLRHIITQSENHIIPLAHQHLRNNAEKEIRDSVRDVMLGVTLSPYHSVDLLIVLYRNAAMVMRILTQFESRPPARMQARVLRDVLRVVATVNFLYIGRNVIENLFAFLPWVGRVADDIGQGLGAGLFTSATGHAAIERCTAYQSWDKDQAVDTLAAQTRDFIRDVKNIFTKDVLPDIKNRIINEAPSEQARDPGFWENFQRGVNAAFDQSIKAVGQLVPKPVWAAPMPHETLDDDEDDDLDTPPPSVRPNNAPQSQPRVVTAPASGHEPKKRRSSRNRRGVSRVLYTFGQRIRYTFGFGNLNK